MVLRTLLTCAFLILNGVVNPAIAQSNFRFDLEGPGLIEGDAGATVEFTVDVHLVESGEALIDESLRLIEAYSVGLNVEGFSIVEIEPLGISESDDSFIESRVVDNKILLAVVRGFEEIVPLDHTVSEHPILRIRLQGEIPSSSGCRDGLLEIQDGLMIPGVNVPVKNVVTADGQSYFPRLANKTIVLCDDLCSRSEILSPSVGPFSVQVSLDPTRTKACFKIDRPRAEDLGRPLLVELKAIGTSIPESSISKLYVHWGSEASPIHFDAKSDSGEIFHRNIILPELRDDIAFIQLETEGLSQELDVQLEIRIPNIALESMGARRGGQNRKIHTTIRGVGFHSLEPESPVFVLKHSESEALIPATEVDIISDRRVDVVFDSGLSPTGLYDLEVRQSIDSVALDQLQGTFELLEVLDEEALFISLQGNDQIRVGRPNRLTLKYKNISDSEIPVPFFKVTAPQNTWLLHGTTRSFSARNPEVQFPENVLQVLGINEDGFAGFLPPGGKGQIPIWIFPEFEVSGKLPIQVQLLTPIQGDPIPWETLSPLHGVEDWVEFRSALENELGSTWVEYRNQLAELTTEVSLQGRDANSDLEILQHVSKSILDLPRSSIRGRLIDNLTKIPVKESIVLAVPEDGGEALCALTNEDGEFVLDHLLEGESYQLQSIDYDIENGNVSAPQTGLELLGTLRDQQIEDFTCAIPETSGIPQESILVRESFQPPVLTTVYTVEKEFIRAIDPNEIRGPKGRGGRRYIDPRRVLNDEGGFDEELHYTVVFENLRTAKGSAQLVEIISDPLDSDLDWSTLRFESAGFGTHTVSLDKEDPFHETCNGGGSSLYEALRIAPPSSLCGPLPGLIGCNSNLPPVNLNINPSTTNATTICRRVAVSVPRFPVDEEEDLIPIWVEIQAQLEFEEEALQDDSTTFHRDPVRVTWSLRALPFNEEDQLPADVGFLLPNDDSHRGEGFVTFSVKARPDPENLREGQEIGVRSRIRFDGDPRELTSSWENTICYSGDPAVPQLLSPGMEAEDVSLRPRFRWESDCRADGYQFEIWPANQEGHPEKHIRVQFLGDEAFTTTFNLEKELDPSVEYRWQVTALGVEGEEVSSAPGQFETACLDEATELTVTHLLCKDDVATVDQSKLTWNAASGASKYIVWILNAGDLTLERAIDAFPTLDSTQVEIALPEDLPSGQYFWQVISLNEQCSEIELGKTTEAQPLTVGENPIFKRGDVDGNGVLEITDAINNLAYQFLGTFSPPCLDSCDFDDNGKIELTDPIGNLSHQFLGTVPPALPGNEVCGEDPTEDELTCLCYEEGCQ